MRKAKWTGNYECSKCGLISDLDQGDEMCCEHCQSPILKLICSSEKVITTKRPLAYCKECGGNCSQN